MNANEPEPDALERRLAGLPLRPVPPEWRAPILAAARMAAKRRSPTEEPAALPWWRAWLWPSPVAWGGVAAAWAVILFLNEAGQWQPLTASPVASVPSPGLGLAFIEHRRQLNELLETPAPGPEPAPAPARSRPRGALPSTNRVV